MPSFFFGRRLHCLLSLATMAIAMAGCASKPVASFRGGRPVLDPEKFFAGHTHSWGIFESRSGEPKEILRTETSGRLENGGLHFEQDLLFGSGKKMHRSWLIQRVDTHHYTATGTGIVGLARGEASGNVFHLDFTLDALPGNPLGRVHMSQWMYLQPDGATLVNRDTLTKAGLIVTEITELFRKDR
jgi:Protein of unknown function (DUF3833)